MTISTVGTLVNSSVTSSQSTVSLTTVNVGDLVVATIGIYANIQLFGILSSNVAWKQAFFFNYNATLGLATFHVMGVATAVGTATVNLTFSSSIGTTKVQRTITQLTAGLGAGTEWNWSWSTRTNTASTTLTYPNTLPATPLGCSYFPYAPNGTQATATGVAPFAYIGYAVGGSTGSAGSTSGFTYTVDANGGVLAVNTALTQGTTPAPTASQGSSNVSLAAGIVVMPYLPGTAFLTQAASGLRIALEVAWGANLTDLTGASWDWTDITGDALMDPGSNRAITAALGSPHDTPGQQTQPSQLTATLLNPAGQYSLGGQSPNYPNVTRNTPLRLRILAGGTWYVRYQAGIVSLQPGWDVTGGWAIAHLTGGGPLRVLNQGTVPVKSVMRTAMDADPNTVAYWPLEDAPSSTTGVCDIPTTGTPAHWNTSINPTTGHFGAYSGFWCSNPIVNIDTGAALQFDVPTYTPNNCLQVSFLLGPTAGSANKVSGTANTTEILTIQLSGTATTVDVQYIQPSGTPNGALWLVINGTTVTQTIYSSDAHNQLCFVQLTQSGSNINWLLGTLVQGNSYTYASGTVTGKTIGHVTTIFANSFPNSGPGPYQIGHMSIQNTASALNMNTQNPGLATSAYINEAPSARLTRLANAASIPITVLASSIGETSANPADSLGPQLVDTVSNLLREVEATSQGILCDGLNMGLTFVTRQKRESQQPVATLDASQGALAVSFEPVDDDSNIVNDVTVTNRNGGSVTYTQLTGAGGINQIGDFQNSITVNQSSNASLLYTAQWLTNLGTPTGYRYPKLEFALEFHPSLIASWLQMFPGARMDVTNISSLRTQMKNATIQNEVTGWAETIDLFTWRVEANCNPYDPWRVITLAAATGSTSDTTCWLDTDGSQLHAAAAQGATSIQVDVTAGPRWVTTADTGGSDNFPFSINLGGVQVQVTNVTGTSNPQTFTVAALPQAFASGTAVSIWDPPVLGM